MGYGFRGASEGSGKEVGGGGEDGEDIGLINWK